jgi:hypothetical protein
MLKLNFVFHYLLHMYQVAFVKHTHTHKWREFQSRSIYLLKCAHTHVYAIPHNDLSKEKYVGVTFENRPHIITCVFKRALFKIECCMSSTR